MKNWALVQNGAQIHEFSSQYHHGCAVGNLIEPDPTCCWFSSALAPLPQYVVIRLGRPITLEKIGIFLHGDNNQNPQEIKFFTSSDGKDYTEIVYDTLEQKPGDFLWTVHKQRVEYVKY